jgi:hypothetical protein
MNSLKLHIIRDILNAKANIIEQLTVEREDVFQDILRGCITRGMFESIRGNISTICYENLVLAKEIFETIIDFVDPQALILIHGSTGKGRGQIAPNIDFDLAETSNSSTKWICRVISPIRSDIDLIIVTKKIECIAPSINKCVIEKFEQYGINITVNLIEPQDTMEELLMASDSPALRRILAFNSPKCFQGLEELDRYRNLALENLTSFDWFFEADYRTLRCLAKILEERKIEAAIFDENELIQVLPSFHISLKREKHIGFPNRRIKISKTTKAK